MRTLVITACVTLPVCLCSPRAAHGETYLTGFADEPSLLQDPEVTATLQLDPRQASQLVEDLRNAADLAAFRHLLETRLSAAQRDCLRLLRWRRLDLLALTDPEICRRIEISEDQAVRITSVVEFQERSIQSALSRVRFRPPQRTAFLSEQRDESRKKIAALLTADQREKLAALLAADCVPTQKSNQP